MKFIIVTAEYNDDSGGIVVLHQLCDKLNKLGEKAYLWPSNKPRLDFKKPLKAFYLFFTYFRKSLKYGFKKNPTLYTPLASYKDLTDAIIIYPEIVVGNPLHAQHVVRWLLHKPGFNNGGKIEFGVNDLFFYYYKAYDDSRYNHHPDNLLHIVSQRSDVYKITNHDKREGTCYLLRKGSKREIVHDLTNSILVDGLSHEETAKIFNKVEFCISYDTYTMYNTYAAMCGCIPIIIPEDRVTKEEWQPLEENRYGIAYGFEDIEYAQKTRPLLVANLTKQEHESDESVNEFIKKCQVYFTI